VEGNFAVKSSAREVAATIIDRCCARGINDVSNLKLQKLLYYTQAWNLAFSKQPLFEDVCEAWVHGPVVAHVFGDYKANRWAPITESSAARVEDVETIAHIDAVLDAYGGFRATELERLTHQESPWIEARKGLAPDEPSRNPISIVKMQEYYSAAIG
jgi:uncharacterized phage-associated protein